LNQIYDELAWLSDFLLHRFDLLLTYFT